jgi:hypothetical protein
MVAALYRPDAKPLFDVSNALLQRRRDDNEMIDNRNDIRHSHSFNGTFPF